MWFPMLEQSARPIAHLTARRLTSPLWMPPRIPRKMWLWIWQ
jgi:hypothetical protein